MPELPEVEALAAFLREHARPGHRSRRRGDISVLKTYDPPLSALSGRVHRRRGPVRQVHRPARPTGPAPGLPPGPGGLAALADKLPRHRSAGQEPAGLRVPSTTASGFDLTEAGTRKRLAVYMVRDPQDVPGIATLGPDPLGR